MSIIQTAKDREKCLSMKWDLERTALWTTEQSIRIWQRQTLFLHKDEKHLKKSSNTVKPAQRHLRLKKFTVETGSSVISVWRTEEDNASTR